MVAGYKSFRAAKAVEGRIEDFAPQYLISFFESQDANSIEPALPFNHAIETVAVFADVSGFTKLTESLAERGDRGTEELGFYLNRYFERLVKMLAKSGGDVFKFAGDAMIILWRPEHDKNGKIDLASMACRAAQCGLYLQEELAGANLAEGVSFSIKVGIGAGAANVLHVGGVCGRTEYFACGPALIDAFKSESMSKAGDTVVSPSVWKLIQNRFEGEILQEGWVLVKTNVTALRNISIKRNYNHTNSVSERLNRYVAAAIKPFLQSGVASWCAELRNTTTLFINLGFSAHDLNDLSKHELDRIQQVLEAVQSNVYQLEGSMNKFLLDDKGSTLLAVLGLPPLSHEDDPIRGVHLALSLVQSLRRLNRQCYVGVTSGIVLCGPVGSGSRREYSVLGDKVNTSARLMQAAAKVSMTKNISEGVVEAPDNENTFFGCILCDKVTANAASRETEICFEELTPLQLKGKVNPEAIFQPGICKVQREPHQVQADNNDVEDLGGVYSVPNFCTTLDQLPKAILSRNNDLIIPKQQREVDLLAMFYQVTAGKISSHVVVLNGDVGVGKTSTCTRFVGRLQSQVQVIPTQVVWNSPQQFNTANQLPACWNNIVTMIQTTCLVDDTAVSQGSINPLHELVQDSNWLSPVGESERTKEAELVDRSTDYIVKLLKSLMGGQVGSEASSRMRNLVIVIDEGQFLSNMDWKLTRQVADKFLGTTWPVIFVVCCRPLYKVRYKPHFRGVSTDYLGIIQNPCNYQTTVDAFPLSDIDKLSCKVLRTNTVPVQLSTFTHHMSGGNPLFAVKCIRSLLSTKPPRLVSVRMVDRAASDAPTEKESSQESRDDSQRGSVEVSHKSQRGFNNGKISPSSSMSHEQLKEELKRHGSKFAEDPMEIVLDNNSHEPFGNVQSLSLRCTKQKSKSSFNLLAPQENPTVSTTSTRGKKRRYLFQDFEDSSRNNIGIPEFPLPYRVRRVFATFLDRLTPEQLLLLKCASVLCLGSGLHTLTFDFNLLMRIYPLEVESLCSNAERTLSRRNKVKNYPLTDLEDSPTHVDAKSLVLSNMRLLMRERLIVPVHVQKRQHYMKFLSTNMLEEKIGSCESPDIEYDVLGQRIFRFGCGFLRDVVYKRMLYAHRKRLHKAVVDMIQNSRTGSGVEYANESRINWILFRNYYFAELDSQRDQYHAMCFGYSNTTAEAGSMDYGTLAARHRMKKRNSLAMAGTAFQSFMVNATSHTLKHKKNNTMVAPMSRRASTSADVLHDVRAPLKDVSFGGGILHSIEHFSLSKRSLAGDSNAPNSGRRNNNTMFSKLKSFLCCIQAEEPVYQSSFRSRGRPKSETSFKRNTPVITNNSECTSTRTGGVVLPETPNNRNILESPASRQVLYASFALAPAVEIDKVTLQQYIDQVNEMMSNLPDLEHLVLIDSDEHKAAMKQSEEDSNSDQVQVLVAPYIPTKPPSHVSDQVPTFMFHEMKDLMMYKPQDRAERLVTVAQHVAYWNFDIFELDRLTEHPLRWLSFFTFLHHDLFETLGISKDTFGRFVQVIELGYINTNYYHNALHAADVLQTVHSLLNSQELSKTLSAQEKCSALIAAIIHDYGHPGVNTPFLIATNHKILSLYKDSEPTTVMEEYHVGEAFKAIEDPRNKANILEYLSIDDLINVKAEIYHLVLATAMANHGKFVESFSVAPEPITGPKPAEVTSALDRRRYLQLCIKCADVANCAKSLHVYREWAVRVAAEFYDQGDQEKKSNLPVSRLMDRDEPAMHIMQRGFIRAIVHPLFSILSESIPTTRSWYARNIRMNYDYWELPE